MKQKKNNMRQSRNEKKKTFSLGIYIYVKTMTMWKTRCLLHNHDDDDEDYYYDNHHWISFWKYNILYYICSLISFCLFQLFSLGLYVFFKDIIIIYIFFSKKNLNRIERFYNRHTYRQTEYPEYRFPFTFLFLEFFFHHFSFFEYI